MPNLTGNDALPQFDTADYAPPQGDACNRCGQPISDSYYRVGQAIACPTCAKIAESEQPTDSHPAFVRACLFGAGGAVIGMVLYALVGIITGLAIGYVSLAVGYVVAKAMMKGSGGRGGRRYQIAAVLLTYAAVSTAAIPVGIAQYIKHHQPAAKASSTQQQVVNESGNPDTRPAKKPPVSALQAIGGLLFLGLASPFLELSSPVSGAIGLFILFIGMRIAWRMTADHSASLVDGPFAVSS
jgi:hypothetical protein